MDDLRGLLDLTSGLAADFYDTLPERPVFPRVTPDELREAFTAPLPEQPTDPVGGVDHHVNHVSPFGVWATVIAQPLSHRQHGGGGWVGHDFFAFPTFFVGLAAFFSAALAAPSAFARAVLSAIFAPGPS